MFAVLSLAHRIWILILGNSSEVGLFFKDFVRGNFWIIPLCSRKFKCKKYSFAAIVEVFNRIALLNINISFWECRIGTAQPTQPFASLTSNLPGLVISGPAWHLFKVSAYFFFSFPLSIIILAHIFSSYSNSNLDFEI